MDCYTNELYQKHTRKFQINKKQSQSEHKRKMIKLSRKHKTVINAKQANINAKQQTEKKILLRTH